MPIIGSSRLYLCYYRMWCVMPWLLVVSGQVQGSRLCVLDERICELPSSRTHSLLPCTWPSWWWAYKCPKHVEQITNAINHSVASIWFSSLRLYNDARTNIHQIYVTKVINVLGPHVKWLTFLFDFNQDLVFSTDFRKTAQYKFSLKYDQR